MKWLIFFFNALHIFRINILIQLCTQYLMMFNDFGLHSIYSQYYISLQLLQFINSSTKTIFGYTVIVCKGLPETTFVKKPRHSEDWCDCMFLDTHGKLNLNIVIPRKTVVGPNGLTATDFPLEICLHYFLLPIRPLERKATLAIICQ